ncbi:hypothetical protein GCM10010517_62040 [Streptosporangium fragile]|uniref:Uncharacterized protein n=1 Tax=Streptosporangium fragile TaxID=46186 RepID=A0ABN3W5Y9_9ACTN
MTPAEPDWSGVLKSLCLVVSSALLLGGALQAGFRAVVSFAGWEREMPVMAVAAQVANPDRRFSATDVDRGALAATYTLTGEPRGTGAGTRDYEIVEDLTGRVDAPRLGGPEATALGRAIKGVVANTAFVDREEDKERREATRKALDGLPAGLSAVAAVEFAGPMTAERMIAFNREHGLCPGADTVYIYSPYRYNDSTGEPPANAIAWNRGMGYRSSGWLTYLCEGEPLPALEAFREWTRQLTSHHDRGLEQFGLDRQSLVGAAREGRVHGFVADSWKVSDLRKLLDAPEVRGVTVTGVAFDPERLRPVSGEG